MQHKSCLKIAKSMLPLWIITNKSIRKFKTFETFRILSITKPNKKAMLIIFMDFSITFPILVISSYFWYKLSKFFPQPKVALTMDFLFYKISDWNSLFWITGYDSKTFQTLYRKTAAVQLLLLSCAQKRRILIGWQSENLHWKLGQRRPSFETILAYLETTA